MPIQLGRARIKITTEDGSLMEGVAIACSVNMLDDIAEEMMQLGPMERIVSRTIEFTATFDDLTVALPLGGEPSPELEELVRVVRFKRNAEAGNLGGSELAE